MGAAQGLIFSPGALWALGVAQAGAEAGVAGKHGRDPVLYLDAGSFAHIGREAVVGRAYAARADAVDAVVDKCVEFLDKGGEIPVPIAVFQFVRFDMFVPDGV